MNESLNRVSKIYPWYSGLSGDLMFYIAINSIWLTEIKGFSAAQVTFITTISTLLSIILQIPILSVIKRIGNTLAVRFGSFLLLVCSILITFCNQYILFIIARVIYEMAFLFKNMGSILIKNNLNYLGKGNEFIKIRSKSNTIYAVVTAIIAFAIGGIFNIFEYLPMILCILTCLFCFLLSFYIYDVSDIKLDEKVEEEHNNIKKNFIFTNKLTLIMLVLYGIFYGVVNIGQQNSKLLIQFELKEYMSFANVATYLGIIIFISRIARVFSNLVYPIIYRKTKERVIYILSACLILAFVLLLIGFFISNNLVLKFIIMTLGFSLILMVRDPIKVYIQNLMLERFDKIYHQTLFAYLAMFRKIGSCLFSAIVSCLLIKLDLSFVMWILLIIAIFNIYFVKKLLKNITPAKL